MKGLFRTGMRRLLALLAVAAGAACACAQKAGIKTNILYDALLTPDLGVELAVAPQWTLELTGNVNLWTVNERRWKQLSLQPEARYWCCRAFSGHFIAANLIGGQFNFGNLPLGFRIPGTDLSILKDSRDQGWMGGAGLAYGYAWILDRHWNLEAEIGLGWVHARYDRFPCATCGTKLESGRHHNYYGPTKAAINLEYVF